MAKHNRSRTETSSFGTSRRVGHDASAFYGLRLYEGGERPDAGGPVNPLPAGSLNAIHHASSEAMTQLPDNCVHLMVTSPPYNAAKDYDEDLTLAEYRGLLRRVFEETWRVLVPGGRACVNIANLGRKPYIPLHAYVIAEMQQIGFQMRGEIIWDKGASAGGSCAWGSWMSPSNPTLRDTHEYILVFTKGGFRRKRPDGEATISRDDFLELTKSVWTFPSVSAKRIGHPAPFPLELPRRLIELYTYRGEVVLDPFCGSGQTCLAARECDRVFVAYEKDTQYVRLARERCAT